MKLPIFQYPRVWLTKHNKISANKNEKQSSHGLQVAKVGSFNLFHCFLFGVLHHFALADHQGVEVGEPEAAHCGSRTEQDVLAIRVIDCEPGNQDEDERRQSSAQHQNAKFGQYFKFPLVIPAAAEKTTVTPSVFQQHDAVHEAEAHACQAAAGEHGLLVLLARDLQPTDIMQSIKVSLVHRVVAHVIVKDNDGYYDCRSMTENNKRYFYRLERSTQEFHIQLIGVLLENVLVHQEEAEPVHDSVQYLIGAVQSQIHAANGHEHPDYGQGDCEQMVLVKADRIRHYGPIQENGSVDMATGIAKHFGARPVPHADPAVEPERTGFLDCHVDDSEMVDAEQEDGKVDNEHELPLGEHVVHSDGGSHSDGQAEHGDQVLDDPNGGLGLTLLVVVDPVESIEEKGVGHDDVEDVGQSQEEGSQGEHDDQEDWMKDCWLGYVVYFGSGLRLLFRLHGVSCDLAGSQFRILLQYFLPMISWSVSFSNTLVSAQNKLQGQQTLSPGQTEIIPILKKHPHFYCSITISQPLRLINLIEYLQVIRLAENLRLFAINWFQIS